MAKITVDKFAFNAVTRFQNIFGNYQNYSCANGINGYCLCFDYKNQLDTFLSNISLDSTSNNKPIYISGLQINGFASAMVLKGSSPITLINSTFTNCKDCLSLNGNNFQLDNVSVTCTGKDKDGVGINLVGNNASVIGGTIQNCATGIQIAGNNNNVGSDLFDAQKHVIAHDNGIAFKVASGNGNFFRALSVDQNDQLDQIDPVSGLKSADGKYSNIEGLDLPLVPIMLNNKNQAITENSLDDALSCVKAGASTDLNDTASIQFRVPITSAGQEIAEISFISKMDPKYQQGKQFFSTATCTVSPVEDMRNLSEARCTLNIPKAQQRQGAVLVLHHHQLGSSTYSLPFVLNQLPKPCGPGVLSTADIISSSDLVGAGGSTLSSLPSGGDTAAAPPASTASSAVDDKKKSGSGDSMGGSNALGNGPVAVTGGGIAGIGATGGIQSSGGCSLNPEGAFDLDLVLVLFGAVTLPLGSLFILRLFYPAKQCQVHSVVEGRRKRF